MKKGIMTPHYLYNAKITKVIDGDTVDAVVDLGFMVSVNVRFRLYGIDTMEKFDKDPTKRELAYKATERLRGLLEGKDVLLKSHKTDKYGRWLAMITIDNFDVSQLMIAEGLAVEYFGGTKN